MRFVLLQHTLPPQADRASHVDFMLETETALETWSLAEWPRRGRVPAQRLAPHRLKYLDYEGPISGNRGFVTRLDRGTFTTEQRSEQVWIVHVVGAKYQGRVHLIAAADVWSLEFQPRT